MYFAQFYDHAVGSNELIPACGSDGVMPLDGRKSIDNMIQDVLVTEGGIKRYPAFVICKSPSNRYSDGAPITWKLFIRRDKS